MRFSHWCSFMELLRKISIWGVFDWKVGKIVLRLKSIRHQQSSAKNFLLKSIDFNCKSFLEKQEDSKFSNTAALLSCFIWFRVFLMETINFCWNSVGGKIWIIKVCIVTWRSFSFFHSRNYFLSFEFNDVSSRRECSLVKVKISTKRVDSFHKFQYLRSKHTFITQLLTSKLIQKISRVQVFTFSFFSQTKHKKMIKTRSQDVRFSISPVCPITVFKKVRNILKVLFPSRDTRRKNDNLWPALSRFILIQKFLFFLLLDEKNTQTGK